MRTYIECIGCLVKQAVEIAQTNLSNELQEEFIRDVLGGLSRFNYSESPPILARNMYSLVRTLTGIHDPYADIKAFYNRKALEMYPYLKKIIRSSKDPVDTALRIAVAGNIIDFGSGTKESIKVENTVQTALDAAFSIDHVDRLREKIKTATSILYLGDNAGEIVFDRLFIEELGAHKVIFAARATPIINDATMEDARQVGLTDVCRVVSSGSEAPGTPLELCTDEFCDIYYSADLVISKGQGNFETLTDPKRSVFFLMMVKCAVISREVGVPVGSFIAMQRP